MVCFIFKETSANEPKKKQINLNYEAEANIKLAKGTQEKSFWEQQVSELSNFVTTSRNGS